MCREAFLPIFGKDKVKVLPFEAFWKTKYTFDMVEHFQKDNPDAEFVLIVGQDEFESLDRWHRIDELRKMVEFFSVGRGSVDGTPGFTITNVSSSAIRDSIRERGADSVRDLVPAPVLDFIKNYDIHPETSDIIVEPILR